jgi:hypothetical protein
MDTSPRFGLVLEGERVKTERQGPLLPEVRSSRASKILTIQISFLFVLGDS